MRSTREPARSSGRPRIGSTIRSLALLGCLMALGACTTFDPLDNRVETINKNANDYANNAILLNIVRAKLGEPLTFVSITGLDSTNGATATIGLPTIVLGPHMGGRDVTFGATSAQRSTSDIFHVSVIDDPGSFAALMTPVSPATIAYFEGQGYDRALLFMLFVDRIERMDKA